MSTVYCDVCGQHVESDGTGRVRICGLESADVDTEEDLGYLNDCPFDSDLTVEDYSDDEQEFPDDYLDDE